MSKIQSDLQKLVVTPEGNALMEDVAAKRDAHNAGRAGVLKAKKDAGGTLTSDELRKLMDAKYLPARMAYIAAVQTVVDRQQSMMDDTRASAAADVSYLRALVCGTTLLALFIGCLAAWWLSRGITRPLRHAVDVAQTVAAVT